MKRTENEAYQMVTHVATFVAQNVALLPETSAAPEILTALESNINTMSEEARIIVSAGTAIRIGRSERKASREKLKAALILAERIAASLNTGMFRMPAKRSERVLIDSGRGFTVDAEPMRNEFAKHGLELDTVSAAVEALEQAILDCSTAKSSRSAASRKWAEALKESLSAVKRYDTLLAATLKDNPGAMASYAVARAIPRTGGKRKAAAENPPVAAVPAEPVTPPVPATPAPTPVIAVPGA